MGWALFRLGKLDDAEEYLRRAMAERPDAEIAAHLGEVLWAKGERERAQEVWQSQLKATPDNPVLLDTVRRLGALTRVRVDGRARERLRAARRALSACAARRCVAVAALLAAALSPARGIGPSRSRRAPVCRSPTPRSPSTAGCPRGAAPTPSPCSFSWRTIRRATSWSVHDAARPDASPSSPATPPRAASKSRIADGRRDAAGDWATLTERALGFPLPVRRAVGVGARRAARRERRTRSKPTRAGRAIVLRQDGWEIVYDYADADGAPAVAAAARLRRDSRCAIVIERWR